jgi:hypothetical protein
MGYGTMKSEADFRMRLSQRKLNCALSVDFLWKKDYRSDNPGCSKEDSGNESQIANFPRNRGVTFLTESLILAQNERWRRG